MTDTLHYIAESSFELLPDTFSENLIRVHKKFGLDISGRWFATYEFQPPPYSQSSNGPTTTNYYYLKNLKDIDLTFLKLIGIDVRKISNNHIEVIIQTIENGSHTVLFNASL